MSGVWSLVREAPIITLGRLDLADNALAFDAMLSAPLHFLNLVAGRSEAIHDIQDRIDINFAHVIISLCRSRIRTSNHR